MSALPFSVPIFVTAAAGEGTVHVSVPPTGRVSPSCLPAKSRFRLYNAD
jgi:hypothetical protein